MKTTRYDLPFLWMFAGILAIAFWMHPTHSRDFVTLARAASIPLTPYDQRGFINPPWLVTFMAWAPLIPMRVALAVNAALNILVMGGLVYTRGGGLYALLLTLTSYPMFILLSNNNVDWIPALAFILQTPWSITLLIIKPQIGALAILSWRDVRARPLAYLAPLAMLTLISFGVWGNWLPALLTNIRAISPNMPGWNFSLFPWSIPLGIALMVWMARHPDHPSAELAGIAATTAFVPYVAAHSLTVFYAILAAKHPRTALIASAVLWGVGLV